jgi:chromosomal replication initiator protein
LIRLAAYSSLTGLEISVELAQNVLKNMISTIAINSDKVQKIVASFFNISIADLRSSRRKKIVALPRQIAMYLTRKHTKMSFPEIGVKFGGKDHTTIMHACKKIGAKMTGDQSLKNIVDSIEKNLFT